MTTVAYNADMALCGGEDCRIREQCKRYKAYLKWENAKKYRFAWFVEQPMYDENTNQCEMFKPLKRT